MSDSNKGSNEDLKKTDEGRLKYTDDNIKNLLGRFGAVYLPSEIRETEDDIIGNEIQKELLEDFFKGLKKYEKIKERLKSAKLVPNLTILLYGPPGTGKTTLARAFSKKYETSICIVESNRLISPLLGDTIKSITRVVELAADVARERGSFVLFFDELDAVGSERSNIHEVGEIKRAVISFLQVIDRINYEGHPLAIIGATNHQHLLDSAIWRRFTFHFEFYFPDYHLRRKIIEAFVNKVKTAKIGVDESIFSNLSKEYNDIQIVSKDLEVKIGRKISEFDSNILWDEFSRRNKQDGLLKLTYGYSGSDIERGTRVALLKSINTGVLTYDNFFNSLKLVGGTAIHVERQDILSHSRQSSGQINRSKELNDNLPGPPEI